MDMAKRPWQLLTLLLSALTAVIAKAEPPAPSPVPAEQTSGVRKGKVSREKEAEGTKAANRFQADTVIKSKYEFNGTPLEVDPD